MPLHFRHLISTQDVTRDDAELVLKTAVEMERIRDAGGDDRLKGKILASLFYEPSTRTRLSFESAMLRLGGRVITVNGIENTSLKKGETLEDTIRMVNNYADIIAMRHFEAGAAARAAAVSIPPFVSAGDGPGEHPTQALLDLYTIRKERGALSGLRIAMVGDLRFSRTVHSLCYLLSLFPDNSLLFVSPTELMMPDDIREFLDDHGVTYRETASFDEAMDCDVIDMTRIQEERYADRAEYERLKDVYQLTGAHMERTQATIISPLPRLHEIAPEVDEYKHAAYFRQAGNAVPVRMAILALLLGAA